MREMYEWLMIKYNVDLMFFGHVHAYERVKPIKDYQVSLPDPQHLIVQCGTAEHSEALHVALQQRLPACESFVATLDTVRLHMARKRHLLM